MSKKMTKIELDAVAEHARDAIIEFTANKLQENPNLYAVMYDLAPEWYPHANKIARTRLAREDWNINQRGGMVSALSPMTRWKLNERDYLNYVVNDVRSGYLPKIRDNKCDLIAALDNPTLEEVQRILNGNKTIAFADNIVNLGTSLRITLDTIMCEIMNISTNMLNRKGVYERLEEMVWELAPLFGFDYAPDFQAFVWCLFRGQPY